jgi:lipoprotein NlpI
LAGRPRMNLRLVSACAAVALCCGAGLALPAFSNTPSSSAPVAPPRDEEAIRGFTSQIESGKLDSPTLAKAYFSRGAAEFRLHRLDAAEADFAKAISLDDKAVYRLSHASSLSALKRYRDAIPDAEAIEKLESKSVVGYAVHAALLEMLGDVSGYTAKLKEIAAMTADPVAIFQEQAGRDFAAGRYEFALVADNLALAVKPNAADIISDRADVLLLLARYAEALAGYDAAIRLDSNGAVATYARRNRPRALYGLGRYKEAEAASIESLRQNPKDAYALLWLHIVRLHLGTENTADLSQRAASVDLSKWPGPIFRYFIGESREDEVYREAEQGSTTDVAGQRCEAAFYVGEEKPRKGDTKDGIASIQHAKEICPPGFAEMAGAQMELEHS